jgi:acyl-homoserine-lactone acylase
MSPRFSRLFASLRFAGCIASLTMLSSCQSWLDNRYRDSLPPDQGTLRVKGLAQSALIRRNSLGMPLIETHSFHDALFTLGYVHATDRLRQMLSMRLMADGRLAEMAGPGMLELDRFMRTVNLRKSAETLYKNASPRIKAFFEVYSRGVNAYLFRYRDRLPMDLSDAGYQPQYWKPEDSALIFCLLNFGLSANLQEEIAALVLTQKVGADKLPWLLPTYPDEPLPFEEAEKLKGLSLREQLPGLKALNHRVALFAEQYMLGVAASNNWAIAPALSRNGKSLLANDTHLPSSLPSLWNFVQIRAPKYQAAGITVAGLPVVIAGFNGNLAWGMTMVMGDNQDLFLEQVKRQDNKVLYLADGKWLVARERRETFFIKGQKPVQQSIFETRHGPLLNSMLAQDQHSEQAPALDSGYGLALQTTQFEADTSLDRFFELSRAQTVDSAFEIAREIRALPLNMVFADANHIGWQVTGRYPNRRAGLGLVPSPGWDSRYEWEGFADSMLHPYDQDPQQGWLGTANQRSAPRGYGMQLSSSWHSPERYERLAELAGRQQHDMQSMIAMQYDQSSPFVNKLQHVFDSPGTNEALRNAIEKLPEETAHKAREALSRLLKMDGTLSPASADAALYAAFLHQSAREIFLDELGPETSPDWNALVEIAKRSYSAQADHLLGREDSPFWDDLRTAEKEDKATILARSLAASIDLLEQRLGNVRSAWQWGKLHRYEWFSASSLLAPHLGAAARADISSLTRYLDRGPYPAGGDHSTLNVAAYNWGQDFNTWLIPGMRIVVDFSREDQSGNPASPHYADGIEAWQRAQYLSFPLKPKNLAGVYGNKGLLLVP